MKLLHTSPQEITNISLTGRFGEFLFFSCDEYVMTGASDCLTYEIDLDEDQIVDASTFFYREDCHLLNDLVEEVMDLTGCDEEQAQEYLSQNESYFEDPEVDWDIQRLTGEAGKILGFRAVEAQDEQGTCYIVSMFGHKKELKLQIK